MLRSLLLALVALLLVPAALAQTNSETRRVVLLNGDVYVGTVADESADPVVVRTTDGVERSFPRAQVELIAPLIRGRFFRTDPVRTRFFISPTARTLGGNEFRGDLTPYPSITAGLSDRVDLLATGFVAFGDGAFVTPLVGLKGQVFQSERTQIALGTSAIALFGDGDDGFLAVPYAVATFGDETRAVTIGAAGLVGGSIGSGDVEIANGIAVGLGFETQVNNGVKLFVESVAGFTEGDSGLLILPGVRFFGNRFAFDVIGIVATDFEDVFGFAPAGARVSYGF